MTSMLGVKLSQNESVRNFACDTKRFVIYSFLCNMSRGENVVVLFTSLSGPDPNKLLLESAALRNVSVYFGIPPMPRVSDEKVDTELIKAYYGWVGRVLMDHKSRYGSMSFRDYTTTIQHGRPTAKEILYNSVAGYYISDEVSLGNPNRTKSILSAYNELSSLIRNVVKKKTAIAPSVDLTKFGSNKTIDDHVQGLRLLAKTSVNVIAVNEGRGYGKAPYYWPTQEELPVSQIDPILNRILIRINPKWKDNGTFRDGFTGSVHEVWKLILSNETNVCN